MNTGLVVAAFKAKTKVMSNENTAFSKKCNKHMCKNSHQLTRRAQRVFFVLGAFDVQAYCFRNLGVITAEKADRDLCRYARLSTCIRTTSVPPVGIFSQA